jgi:hypothetical protein
MGKGDRAEKETLAIDAWTPKQTKKKPELKPRRKPELNQGKNKSTQLKKV